MFGSKLSLIHENFSTLRQLSLSDLEVVFSGNRWQRIMNGLVRNIWREGQDNGTKHSKSGLP